MKVELEGPPQRSALKISIRDAEEGWDIFKWICWKYASDKARALDGRQFVLKKGADTWRVIVYENCFKMTSKINLYLLP